MEILSHSHLIHLSVHFHCPNPEEDHSEGMIPIPNKLTIKWESKRNMVVDTQHITVFKQNSGHIDVVVGQQSTKAYG